MAQAEVIVSEVLVFVAPLQDRLRVRHQTDSRAIDEECPIVGRQRTGYILRLQDEIGDRYRRLMDHLDPTWVEDRYDESLMVPFGKPESAVRS